jgi:aspartate carbamoyltransferase catalytic subunit
MTHAPRRPLEQRHLLGLETLAAAEIRRLLAAARRHDEWLARETPKGDSLRGRLVLLGFFEPSTRTRVSFEVAAKRLGADTITLGASGSSMEKGESLLDTAWTVESIGADCLVMRDAHSGAPAELASRLATLAVVNGGDGRREHPTQGLLDLLALVHRGVEIDGARVAIVGDVLHSRVARSAIYGLTALGAEVRVCGPPTLVPTGLDRLARAPGRVVTVDGLADALHGAAAVMVLRLQRERQEQGLLPSVAEYARLYQITPERLARFAPEAWVLHPGPMNRGVEIDTQVADGPRSLIRDQVKSGVAVRCAVLERACGAGEWAAAAAAVAGEPALAGARA